jgi:uncharacterized protein
MDRNDQQAIEALFEKLAAVERNAPPRDPQAEVYIRERITQQPTAPYYMAQTIVVQGQALAAAEQRLRELEAQGASERSGAGLFGNLFGDRGGLTQSTGSVPRVGRPEVSDPQAGSGFLAGAAQTALGVTGGLLLGNFIADMLRGGKGDTAQAADRGHGPTGHDEPQVDEAAFEDDGDFGDMEI